MTRDVPSRQAVERAIASMWTEILGCDQPANDDNFFDLGGQSIQAMRILSRIEREYHVELPLSVFMEQPTVLEVSQAVLERLAARR